MEWSAKNPVAISVCAYDDRDERPIDCDFMLPDYCPDIAAVMKCTVTPFIQTRQLSGDRLVAEGTAQIKVLYLDEERKKVRVCEFNQPFSSSFLLKSGVGEMPCCELSARTEYVNCRATSPRRLDIHGAFSVHLCVLCAANEALMAECRDEGLFVRPQKVRSIVPIASADKSFTISEVLDIGGRAPIQTLLRTFCTVRTEPLKILPGKMVFKGLLSLRNVYQTEAEESRTEQVDHEIPFSQLIDIEGLNENWQCYAQPEIAASEIQVTANQAGANTLLTVSIKLNVGVSCYAAEEVMVYTDAYSAHCPLKLERKRVEFTAMQHIEATNHTIKEQVELPPNDIAEVLDVWADAAPASARQEDAVTYVDGRLNMYMLARDKNGQIGYYERTAEYSLPFENGVLPTQVSVMPLRVDYTPSGNQLEVRVQLEVTRRCV
ncbi:MAG: DUF3794 domain-containing protein, partial [Clostridia bacterium]|nr:DUF3794 domain-containing protein [Clostridia bacterium]